MSRLVRSESIILAFGLLLLAGYVDVRRRRDALHREHAELLPGGRWYYWEGSEEAPDPSLARLERHERRYIAERVALTISTVLWLFALIVVVARLVTARLSA